MRRILVTAISGDIGNGILKILKENKDIHIFGCDVNEIAVGMDLVEEFWQSKYAVEDGYIEELLEKCKKYEITHLIPVNEREIEVIGKERFRFEKNHIKLVLQSENILEICLDKYITAKFLSQNGFDVPMTYISKNEIPDIKKTYICKPRKSNGSKNIFVFYPDENKEIDDKKQENLVFQEYIECDDEYTIGVFKYKDVINTIAFKRKLKNGYSNQVDLSHDEKLVQIAKKIAEIMQLEGYINIQLRKQKNRYYIFEINPRISGTVRFRHMLGYTDVLWWLDVLDSKSVELYRCPYKKALGIRELNEKYLVLE